MLGSAPSPPVSALAPTTALTTTNVLDSLENGDVGEEEVHEETSAPSSLESQADNSRKPSSVIVESQEVPVPDSASFIIKTVESGPLEGLPTPQEPVVEVIQDEQHFRYIPFIFKIYYASDLFVTACRLVFSNDLNSQRQK